MRSINGLLAVAFAVLSASCAQLEPSAAEQAAAKSFNPPKGKALICVYRPSKPFTGLARRPVFINKQHIASTSLGSFVAVPVEPGTYTVQAGAQALFDTPEFHDAYPDIIVKLRPGQSVFIKQIVHHSKTNSEAPMMMQTGGTSLPIPLGAGFPPFGARVVDSSTGRAECSSLKQVGAEAIESSVSQ
jgi:hypothetical protein